MARKPNYDFERREREKAKAEKSAEKAKAKAAAKQDVEGAAPPTEPETKVLNDGSGGQ